MNRAVTGIVVAVVCVAAITGGAYLLHRHNADHPAATSDETSANDAPTAAVTVAPLTPGSLATHETVFGSVVARPELTQIISVPYECLATQIYVAPGQQIARGQTLLQIRPSVAARATLDDARNTAAAAERDLASVQKRYDQKLAANAELFTAQNALRTAQNHLTGLAQIDPAKPLDLPADADSRITKIDAQPGQTIPAGAPLIELIQTHNVQAKFAVDPSIVSALKAGQSIELTASSGATPFSATITALTNHVDPASHLVDVFAELPSNTLPIDTPLIARFDITHGDGFIVPHDAVVPNENGAYELFTVSSGKAVKHTVKILAEDDAQAQISAADLKGGELVVVTGNYVLEDQMAVSATPAPTTRPEPGDAK